MEDLKLLQYFSIHNHTEYSNLRLADCNIKLEQLIKEAERLNLRGVCITDHECLSGHIKAIQLAKEIRETNKDFKVGLGNEIYLVNSLEEVSINYKSGITKFPHFILLAKNKEGYEALRLLSTHAWKNSFKTGKMERVPTTTQYLSKIMQNPKYKGNIIASSACLGSYIGNKCEEYYNTNNEKCLKEIEQFINACKYLFGEDFYLELQPSFNKEQIRYNKLLINFSNKMNVKTIFSTDTHYLNNKKNLHKSFLQSKEGDREVDDFYASTYMMDSNEVWNYMKDYIDIDYFNQMINNTIEIYDKIKFFDLKQNTIVPQITVPPFNTNNIMKNYCKEYEYISYYYNSSYLIDKYLIFMLLEGMKNHNQSFNEKNLERINIELKELWLISEKLNSRLSSYYLLVQDLVNLMWTISLIGIARGSATGMYICYLLGITQMNPMQFNLCHWRHISASRPC